MTARSTRYTAALVGVLVVALLAIVAAGVGGVALVDIMRSYVAGEAAYSKGQKGAVLALHRYARSGDPADFAEYESLIGIPVNDARAREILEDSSRPREESHRFLEAGQNHPDDVAGMAWLFRYLGETPLFAPQIEIWREADRKVAELVLTAEALAREIGAGGPEAAAVPGLLARIDAIDTQLTEIETAFSNRMGEAARTVAWLLYIGLPGLGVLMAAGAGLIARRTVRRLDAAERAVRERERRFRDIADVAADWIWENDAEGRVTYLSDRLEAVSGIPKSAFLGKPRWELDADPGPEGWDPLRDRLAQREPFTGFEYKIRDSAGGWRIFRISGKPVYAEDGVFHGYRGTGTDVTEERAAQREVAENRELLETTIENLGQGVSVVDANLIAVAFNRRFLELLDFPPEKFAVGDPFEKFVRYNCERGEYGDVDVEAEVARQLDLARRFEPHQIERVRPDGMILEIRGNPLPSGGFVTTYRDVTAERQASAALEESQRRTRAVIDRALDAFVSIDADGVVIDWNPAAEQIFGWPRDEALGCILADLVMPEAMRDRHGKGVQRYLETGEAAIIGRRVEVAALRRTGEEFPVELAVNAETLAGRTVFNAFVRDITERRKAEHELMLAKEAAETANRAKNEFLATMSHELRTPLNAIIGFADVMANQSMGPLDERYVGYAGYIRSSGDHLLSLINDILDISRVEAGKAALDEEPVDLFEAAETCCRLLRRNADDAGVALVNAVARDAPRLIADPRRLRQILLNLVGNAIKFSPEGATVDIAVEEPDGSMGGDRGGGLVLKVVDRGVGIVPLQIERAFKPFVQLSAGLRRSHDGAGLGLALVKRFVEMHGGAIELDSEPGRGTTALVRFPEFRVDRSNPAGAPKAAAQ